jgi:solute carrier family 19 (thiamine transporter), member 2/3
MYAKVEKDRYQQVTGNARAAILGGGFLSGVVAQLLYSFKVMDFRELNYLTLGGKSL